MSNKRKAIETKLTTARDNLVAFLSNLDDAAWQTAVFTDHASAWTILDIVRHLSSAESGMTQLMKNIQSGKGGVPENFDRERYNQRAIDKQADKSPSALLTDIANNRARLLDFMQTIEEDDWGKQGRHASLNIYSIEEICHIIADHEHGHLQDIQQALNK